MAPLVHVKLTKMLANFLARQLTVYGTSMPRGNNENTKNFKKESQKQKQKFKQKQK